MKWFALFFASIACGCMASQGDMLIRSSDIQDFSIKAEKNEQGYLLNFKGLVFHSSLCVDRLIRTSEGDNLQIDIKLTSNCQGHSGRFDERILADAGINTVTFGIDRKVVWQMR